MIRKLLLLGALMCGLAVGAPAPSTAKPVPEDQRVPLDLRRTTLVVRDMDTSLRFYRDALGMKVTYDNVIRTPREARTDAQAERTLRLVLLRANDDFVGQIGLMQYTKPVRPPRPAKGDTTLRPGDIVLLFNTTKIAERYAQAIRSPGVRAAEAPHLTTYPSYDGKGVIRVMFSAMWDPDGHYVELNEVLGGLK